MPPGPEHRQAEEVDVLVVGAGLAGLTTALALTGAGASVRVIDAADAPSSAADLRSTALFPPSVALLEKLGIWRGLAAATAIRSLQIVDRAPPGRRPRQATFKASEIQADELAYNVPNPALRLALEKAASGAPRLQLSRPARLASLARREDAVIAQLQDGTAIRARLLVAADGRNSETRDQAGIGAWRWSHGQKALAFQVRCQRETNGLCTEIHQDGAIFTIIPLAGREAAVVWVLPGARAQRLLEMERAAFVQEVTRFAGPQLEGMGLLAGPAAWPVTALLAQRLTARRLVVVGEAAHVVSPATAQGLNLSFADATLLARLVEAELKQGHDPGGARLLQNYQRTRMPAIAKRVAAVDFYAAATGLSRPPFGPVRRLGLAALSRSPRLRRKAMRWFSNADGPAAAGDTCGGGR